MRDIALSAIIGALLLLTIKHPAVGAFLWAWISIMNPHRLTYGFAHSMPWAAVIAGLTLVMFAVSSKARKPFPMSSLTGVYIALMVWMTVTTLFSINPPEDVKDRWIFVAKIHLMILVTLMLLRDRKHIEILIWVLVVSVGFYGFKGGLFTIATGGSGRVWGPTGSMLEGNNELAVALVAISPLTYYLLQVSKNPWVRRGLMVSLLLFALSILGTQSRGALLALLTMALMLGLKNRHPVRATLLIVGLVAVAIVFMPDSWSSRMDTIQEYRADTSAMSRLYTWHTLWNVALDRPLVGAGFAADNLHVFSTYAPHEERYAPVMGTVWVAHSIYFQALGEHGFVGFGLYMLLGLLTWTRCGKLGRLASANEKFSEWVPLLMKMVQVGLLGFAVGGAFLSLMHLDLIYYLVAIVVLVDASMREAAPRDAPSKSK